MRILSINPKIILTAAITNLTDVIVNRFSPFLPKVTFEETSNRKSTKPHLATH